VIRAARVADAAAVAALHRRAREPWAAFIDEWEPPGVRVWAERLAGDEAETSVFDDGDVRGFVSVAGDEVRALYVDPPSHRRGMGAALLAHVAAERRAAGDRSLVLWVFAANERARAFYAACGWTAEPSTLAPDPVTGVPEIRYRRAL
jgi:GNAT superfamily N-acetyltransferase